MPPPDQQAARRRWADREERSSAREAERRAHAARVDALYEMWFADAVPAAGLDERAFRAFISHKLRRRAAAGDDPPGASPRAADETGYEAESEGRFSLDRPDGSAQTFVPSRWIAEFRGTRWASHGAPRHAPAAGDISSAPPPPPSPPQRRPSHFWSLTLLSEALACFGVAGEPLCGAETEADAAASRQQTVPSLRSDPHEWPTDTDAESRQSREGTGAKRLVQSPLRPAPR